jgi:cytochrome oxidase assembly protein ShyY1
VRALLTRRFAALTLAMLAFVAVCLVAGRWQWSKHVDRDLEIAAAEIGELAPAVPVADLLTTSSPVPADQLFRTVRAVGRYDPERQLVVRFRPLEGVPGSHVLVPLVTDDGPVLLVDRGFLAGAGPDVTVPPPPTGTVTVLGRVREPETGAGTGGDPAGGAIRYLDVPSLAAWLGEPTYVNHVDLVSEDPTVQPAPQPLPPPSIDPGPYLSYGVQWYLFATVAVAGWAALGYRDVRDARQGRGAQGSTGRPGQPARI